MSEDDEVLSALTRLMSGRRGREIYGYERENSSAAASSRQSRGCGHHALAVLSAGYTGCCRMTANRRQRTVARAIYEPLIKPKDRETVSVENVAEG